tara:strand:- start:28 stop:924 length:897 start_codon:yes stop_codon:yes gene_type:complete
MKNNNLSMENYARKIRQEIQFVKGSNGGKDKDIFLFDCAFNTLSRKHNKCKYKFSKVKKFLNEHININAEKFSKLIYLLENYISRHNKNYLDHSDTYFQIFKVQSLVDYHKIIEKGYGKNALAMSAKLKSLQVNSLCSIEELAQTGFKASFQTSKANYYRNAGYLYFPTNKEFATTEIEMCNDLTITAISWSTSSLIVHLKEGDLVVPYTELSDSGVSAKCRDNKVEHINAELVDEELKIFNKKANAYTYFASKRGTILNVHIAGNTIRKAVSLYTDRIVLHTKSGDKTFSYIRCFSR